MSLTIAWLNDNHNSKRKQTVDHNVDALNQQKQFCPLPNMQFIQRKLSLKSKKKNYGASSRASLYYHCQSMEWQTCTN